MTIVAKRFHAGGRVYSLPTRDARLDAVPLERATNAGDLWVGNLGAVARFLAEPVPPLVTPITDPTGKRKLTAETLLRVADLGEVWVGQLRDQAARIRDRDDDELADGSKTHGRGRDVDPDQDPDGREQQRRTTDSGLRHMNAVTRDSIRRMTKAAQATPADFYRGKAPTRDAPRPAIPGATPQERNASHNDRMRAHYGQPPLSR